MSSTLSAPYAQLGKGGDYTIEANFGIRVYTPGEAIPAVDETAYTLKGGLRTNHVGVVPLMDGAKAIVGTAEVLKIVSAKPDRIGEELLKACGFQTVEEALDYVLSMHKEEFERDGVFTVFQYMVVSRK